MFSLKRLSGVPSAFRWAGGVLAASLLALYRISGVPSFLVGPAAAVVVFGAVVVAGLAVAVAVAGLAVPVAVAGFVVAAVVVGLVVAAVVVGLVAAVVVAVFGSFGFFVPAAGGVCAKLIPVKASNKLTIRAIFFIFRECFLMK